MCFSFACDLGPMDPVEITPAALAGGGRNIWAPLIGAWVTMGLLAKSLGPGLSIVFGKPEGMIWFSWHFFWIVGVFPSFLGFFFGKRRFLGVFPCFQGLLCL